MRNVIVYQYGKVASTSLVSALNELEEVRAYQCHFLGYEAFQSIVQRLCNPKLDDYFFEHSLGQLAHNIQAYRYYLRRNEPNSDPCTILSIAREPFDWFRSSLIQEIEGHLPYLKLSVELNNLDCKNDADVVLRGVTLFMERLDLTLNAAPTLDQLTVQVRRGLRDSIHFANDDDFEGYLFLLGRFLMPHFWFKTQFPTAMGISLNDMESIGEGLFGSSTSKGPVYLMKFEQMNDAFSLLLKLEDLGEVKLTRENESQSKPFAEEIRRVLLSNLGESIRKRAVSETSMLLGY